MKDNKMTNKKKTKKATQVDRVLILLHMLSSGNAICLNKELKLIDEMNTYNCSFKHIDVGLRSLQKDMSYIKEFLGDNLSKKENCYQLIKQDSLDDFFQDNHEKIKKFFHAISLIDSSVFGENFKKYAPLLESIKSQQKEVYLFLENPFENLKQLELKKELEQYIQKRNYINIYYHSDKEYIFKRVQAYKIIYANGNWYLAVITTEDYEINAGFKLLRLNFVKKITPCIFAPLHFHEDIQIKDFLNTKFQSLFSSFDKPSFKVTLEISNTVSRYFKVKKFLKSQETIKSTESSLIIQFTINDEMEIIPLIQRWIPHIKVLEPQFLKDKILKNLNAYQSNA